MGGTGVAILTLVWHAMCELCRSMDEAASETAYELLGLQMHARHDHSDMIHTCVTFHTSCTIYRSMDEAAPETFYELLGLQMGASLDDIRGAYRKLQRVVHPDVVGPSAHALAILLNAAVATLSEPNSRCDRGACICVIQSLEAVQPFMGLLIIVYSATSACICVICLLKQYKQYMPPDTDNSVR
jgi:hypothetical protein